MLICIPSQVGADPVHSPNKQVLIGIPISKYPSSQVYVAIAMPPTPILKLTVPLSGSDKASHSIATTMYYYRHSIEWLGIPSQVGGDPVHSPNKQVLIGLPISKYPSSQVYIAIAKPPTPILKLIVPLSGSDKASHSIATTMYYYQHSIKCLGIPSQVGADPVHSPNKQVLIGIPISKYPSSQVYVAIAMPPTPILKLIAPLSGSDKASHSIATTMYYY